MEQVTTIGLDIAKHVFHAHGADERGRAVFSRKISRAKLLAFFGGNRGVWWRWRRVPARITGAGSLLAWDTMCG
jgi:transposase